MPDKPASTVMNWIKRRLKKNAAAINHEAVIKDIVQETHVSPGYFLTLTLANLIALSGLIINSAPVIIGAMLISPLMGAILSFGFAFITGAKTIWTGSLRKIAISVALTIVVAAAASFLSPMKELTPEILSRTRPNLYDLIIAFLAGSAGAAALCTKKNFITVVPGVAIATAVIPPLSVVGFGLGTWTPALIAGGFLLFFTNFVAITIATSFVFFIYGFRPQMISETDVSHLKRRFSYLAAVLVLISIPLIYTLHVSITEVRLRNGLQRVLKQSFDKEQRSRLTSFDYRKSKDGRLEINAVLNTIEYLNEDEIAGAEHTLRDLLAKNIKLSVEQVKVQPGGLKPQLVQTSALPVIAPPQAPQDVIKASRENVLAVVKRSSEKVERIIAPWTISDFTVGFHDKVFSVSLSMKIRRDTPVTDEERRWLARVLEAELNLPVELSVETVPFVPPLLFPVNEADLTDDMKASIKQLQRVRLTEAGFRYRIEAYPGSGPGKPEQRAVVKRRVEGVVQYLARECNIPEDRIEQKIQRRTMTRPEVRLTVLPF